MTAALALIIADRPDRGRAIADALGNAQHREGFIDCAEMRITWCLGHMLELALPPMREWSWEKLPHSFLPSHNRPIDKRRTHLDRMVDMIRSATCMIHAGDPDDEGQLIVDEVIEWAHADLPVNRLIFHVADPASIRSALQVLRPNTDYANLSTAAKARQLADAIHGINLTRAYTLAANEKGFADVLTVGRVQNAILGIVVRRERAYAATRKSSGASAGLAIRFDDVVIGVNSSDQPHPANFDTQGLNGTAAKVIARRAEKVSTPPPLPHSLLSLQVEAARQYGLSPDQVSQIARKLHDAYQLITFPRSDCRYLPDTEHGRARRLLRAVSRNLPDLTTLVDVADMNLVSAAFNSANVGTHHAIIPTAATPAMLLLSKAERAIYTLVSQNYLAQFLTPWEVQRIVVNIAVAGQSFRAQADLTTVSGWTAIRSLQSQDTEQFATRSNAAQAGAIAGLRIHQDGICEQRSEYSSQAPDTRHTIATLLDALGRIEQDVQDADLRRTVASSLAAGAPGIVGTAATRDTIIKELFEQDYLSLDGDRVVATHKGYILHDALPAAMTYPDMAAHWHLQLRKIEQGTLDADVFLQSVENNTAAAIDDIRRRGIPVDMEAPACPLCAEKLIRKRTKEPPQRHFWRCASQTCSFTANDNDGKPVIRKAMAPPPISDTFSCRVCGSGLRRRKSVKAADSFFWACSAFPSCRQTYRDVSGRPLYPATSVTKENHP
ncbi:DNA topoisomerase [Novosphingobium acidiphilum]|uniref:DNA topoisomerase n=1 Tax=Novosphingobium acidiphilum TaxID=505248 RepID=UPI000A01513C|nr:DNA topoisomerase [Novosphingobium acidiphilum]